MMIAFFTLAATALSAATPGLALPSPMLSPTTVVRSGIDSQGRATVTIVHAARIGERYADELAAANAQPRLAMTAGADGQLGPVHYYDFQ